MTNNSKESKNSPNIKRIANQNPQKKNIPDFGSGVPLMEGKEPKRTDEKP